MLKHELEAVLARHLGPVKAPPQLTCPSGISDSPAPNRATVRRLRPLAAAMAAAAALLLLFLWLRPPSSVLHSADPVQISAWLKLRSFDVPLRRDPPSIIHLTSAHVNGTTAEVDYQIAGRGARLTVSPPSAAAPASGSYRVVRSHLVRGQLFTLACAFPQDARTACLLCHMGAQLN
ncbi:MAG TPA: hypothetical protein VKV74_05230 [Bryobacteraceae bacterium]|nr:hypothetical protein [Bryobacteraceae bacterium]